MRASWLRYFITSALKGSAVGRRLVGGGSRMAVRGATEGCLGGVLDVIHTEQMEQPAQLHQRHVPFP